MEILNINLQMKTLNLAFKKSEYIYILYSLTHILYMKSLAMHFTNQQLSFDTFTVGNLQNIFMEHDLYLIS